MNTSSNESLPFLLCTAIASVVTAALSQDGGTTWTPAVQMVIPTESGLLEVQNQTAKVGGHTVALVYSAAYNAAWIGPSEQTIGPTAQSYFGIKGVIWSCRVGLVDLYLRPSVGSVLPSQLGEFATAWLANTQSQDWTAVYKKGTVRYNFINLFGVPAVFSARQEVPPIRTIAVIPTANGVTLSFESAAGKTLDLFCSTNMDILTAQINGKPVPLLCNWKPVKGWVPWTAPSTGSVLSAEGQLPALGSQKALWHGGPQRADLTDSRAVLLLASGDLWTGPISCSLVLLNGKMVGLTTDRKGGHLLMYVGPRTRIPMVEGQTIPAFQSALQQYEADLAAGRVQADKTIKVSDLFTGDAAQKLAVVQDLQVKAIKFAGTNLLVRLSVELVPPPGFDPTLPQNGVEPPGNISKIQLELAPDLTVVSAQTGWH